MQLAGGFSHALATYAEHVGDEFLSHDPQVGGQTLQREQQSAAQLFVHRVMTITHCGLRRLSEQGLGVAERDVHR